LKHVVPEGSSKEIKAGGGRRFFALLEKEQQRQMERVVDSYLASRRRLQIGLLEQVLIRERIEQCLKEMLNMPCKPAQDLANARIRGWFGGIKSAATVETKVGSIELKRLMQHIRDQRAGGLSGLDEDSSGGEDVTGESLLQVVCGVGTLGVLGGIAFKLLTKAKEEENQALLLRQSNARWHDFAKRALRAYALAINYQGPDLFPPGVNDDDVLDQLQRWERNQKAGVAQEQMLGVAQAVNIENEVRRLSDMLGERDKTIDSLRQQIDSLKRWHAERREEKGWEGGGDWGSRPELAFEGNIDRALVPQYQAGASSYSSAQPAWEE